LPFAGVEPHVERAFTLEAEASAGVFQLVAGDAEVEEDGVRRLEAGLGGDPLEVREVAVGRLEGGAELDQRRLGAGQRVRVAVQPEQPAAGPDALEQGTRVATPAQGAVDDDRPRSGLEQLYDLL